VARQTPLGVLVDTNDLAWVQLEPDTAYKLLWTSEESGAWTMLVRADAGATNARHRHLGPADFFVLSGQIDYAGGSAGPGCWLYEPVGAVHDRTSHPVDTVYLANVRGPLEILDDDGRTITVIDGFRFRRDVEQAGRTTAANVATA
jgi:anti-sigma factor ChrR (cupin superfamily)